jgi:hypothetical protein
MNLAKNKVLNQRQLTIDEVVQLKNQLKKVNWDEGTILDYMEHHNVLQTTYIYEGGQQLNLWSHRKVNKIVDTVGKLLAWLGTPKGFTVNLWLQDKPRIIKANQWPDKGTVNGGFTFQGSNTIYIYREEEYERVLIHEIIHALQWDWKMPSYPLLCWNIQGTLAPHLFEAWTECYAEWLYCVFYNISWRQQLNWQRYQALQILSRGGNTKWNENTNVFAYYILKHALAQHMLFLLTFQQGITSTENNFVLCDLVKIPLEQLYKEALSITPEIMSLRMSLKND